MSLLLCRKEPVKHPYFAERLGVNLYSSQELSYVIFQNPVLVLDDFVDHALIAFIRDELDMGFLALKLERWIKSGENPDELLAMILQETSYYTPAEITRFRQQTAALRKLHPAEFLKTRGDKWFALGQYGKAVVCYEKITVMERDSVLDDAFLGKIWKSLGAACARMFRTEKAWKAYDKAYELQKDVQCVKWMYYLTLLDDKLSLNERFRAIADEEGTAWKEEFEQAGQEAENSEEVQELHRLFAKDSLKRAEGTGILIRKWKKEYRSML